MRGGGEEEEEEGCSDVGRRCLPLLSPTLYPHAPYLPTLPPIVERRPWPAARRRCRASVQRATSRPPTAQCSCGAPAAWAPSTRAAWRAVRRRKGGCWYHSPPSSSNRPPFPPCSGPRRAWPGRHIYVLREHPGVGGGGHRGQVKRRRRRTGGAPSTEGFKLRGCGSSNSGRSGWQHK